MKVREFRSDTMTLPTEAMRNAMRDAAVGDDVVDEDPTVKELQDMSADILGMEAALFVPSGTFGNQCAVGVHCRPGEEVILSETTHIIDHEAGAGAALWGVQTRTVTPSSRSYLTADQISPRIRTVEDIHHPPTALIVVENALADGTVMPLEEMAAVKRLAEKNRVEVHLDGARLFNAAVAMGVDVKEITAHVDSAMFCLSKGLGAPVGSILGGSVDFIAAAKRKRKVMGGGMRQVGVLAAPGIIAITDGAGRLEEDHRNAKNLTDMIADHPRVLMDTSQVQTNMVFFQLQESVNVTMQGLVDHLSTKSMLTYEPGWWGLRFVMSSRVDEEDVRALGKEILAYLED